MLGFHSFHTALDTNVGIELLMIIKKRQRIGPEGESMSAAEHFYVLAS
jgi:hypothetical protein